MHYNRVVKHRNSTSGIPEIKDRFPEVGGVPLQEKG
jgi:hypothetical protein